MTTHDERGRPPSSPSGHELNRLGSAGSFVCWFWYFVTMGSARRGADGASTAQDYLGTWTGSWEGGGGTGGLEITLEKGEAGLGGRVSVTGEPTYKATLRTVAFDGPKMTAKYDFSS
jgi:hypothetical protein